jgi:hypothetical protein
VWQLGSAEWQLGSAEVVFRRTSLQLLALMQAHLFALVVGEAVGQNRSG